MPAKEGAGFEFTAVAVIGMEFPVLQGLRVPLLNGIASWQPPGAS